MNQIFSCRKYNFLELIFRIRILFIKVRFLRGGFSERRVKNEHRNKISTSGFLIFVGLWQSIKIHCDSLKSKVYFGFILSKSILTRSCDIMSRVFKNIDSTETYQKFRTRMMTPRIDVCLLSKRCNISKMHQKQSGFRDMFSTIQQFEKYEQKRDFHDLSNVITSIL